MEAGLDIVIVPRREMLDAPFTSLEAITRRPPTQRASVAGGRRASREPRPRMLRAYNSLFLDVYRVLSVLPVVCRLHEKP